MNLVKHIATARWPRQVSVRYCLILYICNLTRYVRFSGQRCGPFYPLVSSVSIQSRALMANRMLLHIAINGAFDRSLGVISELLLHVLVATTIEGQRRLRED